MKLAAWVLAGGLALAMGASAAAQAHEGTMSDREVESLRDATGAPIDRLAAYERILNDREAMISKLLAKPKRVGFAEDMHDAMEEFSEIADELNDNLDEYDAKHRDVRKALPKLIAATERWSTVLRAAGDNEQFVIARRIGLDHLKDMHDLAVEMQGTQEAYFKEHPEALKADKDRVSGNAPQ